ncbi:MAG TPA: hypothetical protein VGL53_15130 [Bryobacteraceae bacterium]|jgi:hypothetical protein
MDISSLVESTVGGLTEKAFVQREHPEYMSRKRVWKLYRDLYAGGQRIRDTASEYIRPRFREPSDVYLERLSKVFYENYIGSIVDWYGATLFRREPVLTFTGVNEPGKAFFGTFIDDCDRKGTNLSDFLRNRFVDALVGGTSYILVDFPKVEVPVETRGAEDQSGRSRAYLVGYTVDDLINWRHDAEGNFEWVVLRTTSVESNDSKDGEWKHVTHYLYYDKQTYRMFRQTSVGYGGGGAIEQVDSGYHGLAKQNRVPLFRMQVPEGLWLLNRAGSLQLEHFEKANALAWSLTMGLFAMPVVYTDREWKQIIGESYFIQLAPGDKFGWTEPEGKVYQIAADNLTRLRDEIYRITYLAQQGGSLGTNSNQSAASKERDFVTTQEVLRSYGDVIKDLTRRVLTAVDEAREDDLEIAVSGLDEFDIGDFSDELADATQLLAIGIESPTLKSQIYKRLALKYLCDVKQDIKDRIVSEIDQSFNKPQA